MPSPLNKVYFWFSLTFLITRTVTVSLLASYIHDESKKPIAILRAIPRSAWCKEAYRFSEEVVNETVALSGMKFFFVTRKMILTVVYLKISKHDSFAFVFIMILLHSRSLRPSLHTNLCCYN